MLAMLFVEISTCNYGALTGLCSLYTRFTSVIRAVYGYYRVSIMTI